MLYWQVMAGSRPTASGIGGEDLRQERREHAGEGEPLNDEQRDVQLIKGSLYINITAYARDTHNIQQGDSLSVETHHDCIRLSEPEVTEDGHED